MGAQGSTPSDTNQTTNENTARTRRTYGNRVHTPQTRAGWTDVPLVSPLSDLTICPFLTLPRELRDRVFDLLLQNVEEIHIKAKGRQPIKHKHDLLRVSKQVRAEFIDRMKRILPATAEIVVAEVEGLDFRTLHSALKVIKPADLATFQVGQRLLRVRLTMHDAEIHLSLGKWVGFVEKNGFSVTYGVKEVDDFYCKELVSRLDQLRATYEPDENGQKRYGSVEASWVRLCRWSWTGI